MIRDSIWPGRINQKHVQRNEEPGDPVPVLEVGECADPLNAQLQSHFCIVSGQLWSPGCGHRVAAGLSAWRPAAARRRCVRRCGYRAAPDVGRDDRRRAGPRSRGHALADLIVVRRSAWEAASCASRNGTPASSAEVLTMILQWFLFAASADVAVDIFRRGWPGLGGGDPGSGYRRVDDAVLQP